VSEIDDHIGGHGVTHLPAGVAAPTIQHEVGEGERRFHEARGIDPLGDLWREGRKKPKRLPESRGGVPKYKPPPAEIAPPPTPVASPPAPQDVLFEIMCEIAEGSSRCPASDALDRMLAARCPRGGGDGPRRSSSNQLAITGKLVVKIHGKNWRTIEILTGAAAGRSTLSSAAAVYRIADKSGYRYLKRPPDSKPEAKIAARPRTTMRAAWSPPVIPETVSIDGQIAELKRMMEAMRRSYPKFIVDGRLGAGAAEHRLAAIAGAIATLKKLRDA
jgi:hypothetical protein